MILTVTLIVALDVTYTVDELVPHSSHRVRAVVERAGGKGLNVARVLEALGEPVVATGLVGGVTGARARGLLDAKHSFVEIAGESRRTVVLADGGDATGFWEPGPVVTADEWAAFVHHYTGLLGVARVVVLSGSLPQGLPVGAYAELVRLARERGVPSILDTSGAPLLAALPAAPTVIKPNAEELAEAAASGRNFPKVAANRAAEAATFPKLRPEAHTAPAAAEAVISAARALRERGAGNVFASRGGDGMLAVTGDGVWRAATPERVRGNPTGAGDAAVAAIARGLAYKMAWPLILRDAVALSAAAVHAPEAGAFDRAEYLKLSRAVTPEEC